MLVLASREEVALTVVRAGARPGVVLLCQAAEVESGLRELARGGLSLKGPRRTLITSDGLLDGTRHGCYD